MEKIIDLQGLEYCSFKKKEDTIVILINGDNEDVLPKIKEKTIDFIFTDPPYSMDMKGGAGKSKIAQRKLKQKKDILDLCFNFNYEFIFNQCDRIIKKKNYLFFCSDRQLPQYMNKYPEMYRVFVWHKQNSIPTVNNTMWNNLEFLIYIREQGAYFNNDLSYEEKSKLITTPIMDQSRIHPTEKPQKVLAHWIKLFSKPNDIVLDMFSGSASTAMTCKLLGRKCICIEKNTKFYQSSKKRLEDEFYNKFDF